MTPLRLGLIGLGRFAQHHLEAFRQMEDVTIAAVCDVDPERVATVQREWGCRGHTDWRAMLAAGEIDAVDVLTPEGLHREPTVAALEAGCHVFVEKPIATTLADADAMIRAAEHAGKALTVGHLLRFDDRYARLAQAIQEGSLGKLAALYARRNNGRRYFPLFRRVAPVFILGIHDIDLMLWYTGDYVTEVHAMAGHTLGDPTPDTSWALLRFAGGAVGVLENHWLLPDGAPSFMDAQFDVTGDRGIASVRDPPPELTLISDGSTDQPVLRAGLALRAELRHFVTCAREGRPSPVLRPEAARNALRVALAVAESAATGQTVRLAPEEYR